jgi:hypothetical protein
MSILETVMWKKYSIDLNTGSESEYINMAVEITAKQCLDICKDVQENLEVNLRLKPLVVQVTDSCAVKINESFLK